MYFTQVYRHKISQLHIRFMGMRSIVNKFKFIFPRNLVLYSDTELTRFAKILVEQYSNDLSISFVQQILSFKSVLLKI